MIFNMHPNFKISNTQSNKNNLSCKKFNLTSIHPR